MTVKSVFHTTSVPLHQQNEQHMEISDLSSVVCESPGNYSNHTDASGFPSSLIKTTDLKSPGEPGHEGHLWRMLLSTLKYRCTLNLWFLY